MSKTFTTADVAAHKDAESGLYIIVDENVYDVTGTSPFPFCALAALGPHCARKERKKGANSRTGFVDEHPGGSKILKRVAGKDASKQFWKYHNESVLKKYSERLKVGVVGEKAKL